MSLQWNASTDSGGSGLAGYNVYRGGVQIGTTPAGTLAFTATGLAASTTYAFTVRARDGAGNLSGASATLNVTTSTVSTTADGTRIRLSGVDFGSSSVTLYKDSITAANKIATVGVGSTGGFTTWQQVAMNLTTPTTGVHDLYILFNTPYVDPNGLVNFDWIQFR